jgi:hypothetical protein
MSPGQLHSQSHIPPPSLAIKTFDVDTSEVDNSHITTLNSSLPRNIGCENSQTCFFSSFDCANINRDVITNSIADFGPWLDRQIIVPHPSSHPFILSLTHSSFLFSIHPSSSSFTILPIQTSRFSLLPASTTTPHFLKKINFPYLTLAQYWLWKLTYMFFFLVRLREYKSGRDNHHHSRLRSVTRSSNHCPTIYLPPSHPSILPLTHPSFLSPIHPSSSSFPIIPIQNITLLLKNHLLSHRYFLIYHDVALIPLSQWNSYQPLISFPEHFPSSLILPSWTPYIVS